MMMKIERGARSLGEGRWEPADRVVMDAATARVLQRALNLSRFRVGVSAEERRVAQELHKLIQDGNPR